MDGLELLTIEDEVTIKATADQFLDVMKNQQLKIPLYTPGLDIKVEKVDGMYIWICFIDGRNEFFKGTVEVDEEKKSVSFCFVEADVYKQYKVFRSFYYATSKAEGCLVQNVLEIEKRNEHIPIPITHLYFNISIAKDIGEAFSKAC